MVLTEVIVAYTFTKRFVVEGNWCEIFDCCNFVVEFCEFFGNG